MFGKILQQWRGRGMVSARDLAARAKCSTEYIRLIEKDSRLPSPALISRLGSACGIPAAEVESVLQEVSKVRTVRNLGKPLESYPHVDDVVAALSAHLRPLLTDIGLPETDIQIVLEETRAKLVALLR